MAHRDHSDPQHPKSQEAAFRARQQARKNIQSASSASSTPEELASRILEGDREALSKAITKSESTLRKDQDFIESLFARLDISNRPVRSRRFGVTGAPGVGKSTFIEGFGMEWIQRGHRVAVLAIDPTSQRTKGSILGDKTRMEKLSQHPMAFVRPSPAASWLGGTTCSTHQAILLCEAAGYDCIIVETVGVGQSETSVRELTDAFILLMLPGGGDDLQGIKRGIMEMADLILVNKADGDAITMAKQTAQQYRNALHMMPLPDGGHQVEVMAISALENQGVREVCATLNQLFKIWEENNWWLGQRAQQNVRQFHQLVHQFLLNTVQSSSEIEAQWETAINRVRLGQTTAFEAAHHWIQMKKS